MQFNQLGIIIHHVYNGSNGGTDGSKTSWLASLEHN